MNDYLTEFEAFLAFVENRKVSKKNIEQTLIDFEKATIRNRKEVFTVSLQNNCTNIGQN